MTAKATAIKEKQPRAARSLAWRALLSKKKGEKLQDAWRPSGKGSKKVNVLRKHIMRSMTGSKFMKKISEAKEKDSRQGSGES